MPKITESEFKAQLKSSDFSHLYFIYGEDNYLKSVYSNKIVNACVNNILPELNFQKISGKTGSLQEISDQSDQLPVMADKRCVVITDLDVGSMGKNEFDDLKNIITSVSETTVLVFLLDSIELDKKKSNWNSFLRSCEKIGSVLECNYKTDSEVIKYISAWAGKSNVIFEKSIGNYLIETCGKDLQKLKSEVDKLCAYKKDSYVSKEDIDRLSAKTPEATKYMLPKAILSENIGNSLNVLADLIEMRIKTDEILNCIIESFLDVFRVKTAIECGKKPIDIAEDFGYSKKRTFVLNNSAFTAKKLSFSVLERCLDILCEAEERINTFKEKNERLLMEKTIILLIETMRGYIYKND